MEIFVFWSVVASTFVILVGTIWILLYKITKLKLKLTFIEENYNKLLQHAEQLELDKLSSIQEIQELKTRIEFIKLDNNKKEKMNEEALQLAKASLLDLGNDLSKQLIALHKQETEQSRRLSENNIYNINLKFQQEFQKLLEIIAVLNNKVDESTKIVEVIKSSLLSPSGVGMLAEITLENILKASGLRAKYDFIMQCNLTSNEDNGRLRPDALIFLPGNNLMIIDAKASKFLIDMPHTTDSAVDTAKADRLKKSINLHLKNLSSKEYAKAIVDSYQFEAHNFNNIITLMFLPTETAIENLSNIDREFIHRSWELNIFPVGPSGLMNMLSFAKFQIKEQMRYENQKLILNEVEKVILSITLLTEHAHKLGNNIQSIVNSYDQFAASFNSNFLSKAKTIQQLGIETKKSRNIDNSKLMLPRYQLVSSKSDIDMVNTKINSTNKVLN
ncbi:rmuC family protein [Orientia chuto str. Dubai]|uniref:DNA recombination protein RmuC homolog n=1 Tax=Orientia chuto str. Dubai TaxID=1359168 RepID=A0A0F3MM06_9RICK|nr:DNA recombination protein RmuC [Candidatus Orientia mediorientalis]KJV56770.1 rmuC family protein [Orientia chuto str. Dubai]